MYEKIQSEIDEENDINQENPNMYSFENLMIKEIKNIIRICDICGQEMVLVDQDSFICQECGYHLKILNE